MAAIVGGGRGAKPGEISLAHHGVLFLDELPEFPRQVLETLRQPIETGDVVVARANAHVRYPCRFLLVAAANPCRCGHLADPALACARVPDCGADYLGRISGPLIDRFDLRVEVPPVSLDDLSAPSGGEPSASIAARVARARGIQRARFAGHDGITVNADAEGDLLDTIARLGDGAAQLLADVAARFRLSARAYHRVLRVARTIADLEELRGDREAAPRRSGRLPPGLLISLRSRRPTPAPGRPGTRPETASGGGRSSAGRYERCTEPSGSGSDNPGGSPRPDRIPAPARSW